VAWPNDSAERHQHVQSVMNIAASTGDIHRLWGQGLMTFYFSENVTKIFQLLNGHT